MCFENLCDNLVIRPTTIVAISQYIIADPSLVWLSPKLLTGALGLSEWPKPEIATIVSIKAQIPKKKWR